MSKKIIAITGASSGIGEAAARRLAKSGAAVLIGARRTDRLGRIVSEIREAGGEAFAAELDVTCCDSMDRFVGRAIADFGKLDVLVLNAGIMMLSAWAELRRADWDRMFDVNVKGVMNGIASALPHMLAQQSGHLIMIGSTSGHRVSPMGGAYAATKFALRAIAESLRIEGGSEIRSTLISPSGTQTEILEHVAPSEMKRDHGEFERFYAHGGSCCKCNSFRH